MKRKIKKRTFVVETIEGKEFRKFIDKIAKQFPNEELIGYRAKKHDEGVLLKAIYCECLYKD